MFIHAIDPVLLKLGFFEIRFYGIVYVFGFLLSYYILYKNKEKLKLNIKQIDNLAFYFLIGLIIGARLFYFIFSNPNILLKDPLEFFRIWNGGMSFYGGFLGSITASYLYLKNKFWDFADIIAIPVSFALILGRIANFINGEIVGTVSNLPWCVIFSKLDNLCRHPYQIYGAISHAILFGGLCFIRKLNLKKGDLFFSFIGGYSLLRIITDFWRYEPRYLGLTVWQYASIFIFIIVIFYRNIYKRKSFSKLSDVIK